MDANICLMKIGIITFHRAHNYGAVLQCYALSQVLKENGNTVSVIDYLPEQFSIEYSLFPFRNLSFKQKIVGLFKLLLVFDIKLKRSKVFNLFISKLPLSSVRLNESNFAIDKYDYIFFGSDQIWNPNLTKHVDNVYSGNFDGNGAKFISYAASSNPDVFITKYEEYFRGIISRFSAISVREYSLATYLNTLSPNCYKVVYDPVLLLNAESWATISERPKVSKYLLIYTVPQSSVVNEVAEQIAREMNLKVIELRPNVRNVRKTGFIQTASPTEFLGYIQYADFVVTTSFHGTALSVVFNKEFLTLSLNEKIDDRAKNLLASVGLQDRLVKKYDGKLSDINWKSVNSKLQERVKDSLNFIKEALKEK